ncbi:hypothetical protein DPMN_032942 [Dreissena polymorpha]|uniref:Uncharacterized protein n=2 Tax=Dreissena polymorpha TaxID=45954 RepID=A0A9D4M7L2_DREPO|nr:hypothetical protein DPMN_032942 [Dreissena polymorpha]
MFRLRGMGLYTNEIMSQHLPGRGDGDHEQFLIACLMKGDEIRRNETGVLDKYKSFLCDLKRPQFGGRFTRHGRVVVVLNAEGQHTHGEARLLDFDGELRHLFG